MSSISGKSVVVTGGAGFIGSHLVDRLLEEGASKVAVVDNFFLGKEENLAEAKETHEDKLSIYREDASDYAAMLEICNLQKPDVIYNLATKALLYSFFNPPGAFSINTDIALCLGELLRMGSYKKLVHLSSSEVYGTAQYVPMDEKHPLLPETTYAAGKAGADLALFAYSNMFDLDIITLRPFNNYGPRQNSGNLAAIIPLTVKRIFDGDTPIVQGGGDQTRDFIYVKDTVEAILKMTFMQGTKGKVYNLGSGIETSINEIINTVCAELSYKGEIKREAKRKADVMRHCAGIEEIKALIGDVSLTNLKDGVKETVEWYKANNTNQ